MRGQNTEDRVRRGRIDTSDKSKLWKVFDNNMQRTREHRLERQLHGSEIFPRSLQQVSYLKS